MRNIPTRLKLLEKIVTKLAVVLSVFTLAIAMVLTWFAIPGYTMDSLNRQPRSTGSTVELKRYEYMGTNLFTVYGVTKPKMVHNFRLFTDETGCLAQSISSGEVSIGFTTRDVFLVACQAQSVAGYIKTNPVETE